MNPAVIQTMLPLVVLGVVFALRWRNMSRPRPLRPGRLWIGPLVMVAVVALAVFGMPLSGYGLLALTFGLALGAPIGWRRAHMLHLSRDAVSGTLQTRQTPAALLLIVALLVVKRLLVPHPGADASGHLPAQALIATDGLMGFALGMVLATNLTLWLRAKAVPAHSPEQSEI